jgi:hypothetical protein
VTQLYGTSQRIRSPRFPPPLPDRLVHGVKGLPLEEERSTPEGSNSAGQDPFQIQISQSIRATVLSFLVPAIPSHTHSIPLPTHTSPGFPMRRAANTRKSANLRFFLSRSPLSLLFALFFLRAFFGFAERELKRKKSSGAHFCRFYQQNCRHQHCRMIIRCHTKPLYASYRPIIRWRGRDF